MMSLNNNVIQRYNPENIAKPVGSYSHVTKISRDAEMYVFSGQIGIDRNNQIPADFNQQVTNTMSNIVDILSSQQLTPGTMSSKSTSGPPKRSIGTISTPSGMKCSALRPPP